MKDAVTLSHGGGSPERRTPRELLESRLADALLQLLGEEMDPLVRPSDRADYQANGALSVRDRGMSTLRLAQDIVDLAQLDEVASVVTVGGRGFINLTLRSDFILEQLVHLATSPRAGIRLDSPQRIVVDYSHPNVAKEMHVGHLRTTLIGDALVRILTEKGHEVVKENHIGDWGTPFGMLIEHLLDEGVSDSARQLDLGELTTFYRAARTKFDNSAEFADRARRRVVALQTGHHESVSLWRILVEHSTNYFQHVYNRLGVLLTRADIVGESHYNSSLESTLRELRESGVAVLSQGAWCSFPAGFVGRDGQPTPLIVKKSDGGFGYAATDLAAIRDRLGNIMATRVLYVVGAPQYDHLAMCFATARAAGWVPEGSQLLHVAFGNVLGADRRPFRTRSGESVRLIDLIDEAVARARVLVADKGLGLPVREQAAVAEAVGIGALKYADLSIDRVKDYVFDWNRMLTFEGNSGPYLQYAHARARSILARAGDRTCIVDPDIAYVLTAGERRLSLLLLDYPRAVDEVLRELTPHRLCSYLYSVATAFNSMYETHPILKATGLEGQGRLLMTDLTSKVLASGLNLLGISAPPRL